MCIIENYRLLIMQDKVTRLLRWAKGETASPYKIDLEPTHGCNLRCVFCWTRDEQRLGYAAYRRPLSRERLLTLIDEAAEMGVAEWQVAGGWEPMIKPALGLEIMERIKAHGMYGSLTTNGTLFNEQIIKRMVEIGWDQVLYSVEGATSETHDKLVGKQGAFGKILDSLALFQKYMRLADTKKPVISFHTVITEYNWLEIADMFDVAARFGIVGVDVEPVTIWNQELSHYRMSSQSKEAFLASIPDILKKARRLKVATNLQKMLDRNLIDKSKLDKTIASDRLSCQAADNPLLSVPCYEPWLNMEVRASGHVVPCRLNDDDDYVHIEDYSLKEIWLGDFFEDIRGLMLRGQLPGYCKTCAAGKLVQNRLLRQRLRDAYNSLPLSETSKAVVQVPVISEPERQSREFERLKRRLNALDEQAEFLENELLEVQNQLLSLEGYKKDYKRINSNIFYKLYIKINNLITKF